MDYVICSKEFKEFYQKLNKSQANIRDCIQEISDALPPVAARLNIGRFHSALTAPATIYEPTGLDASIDLYVSEQGFDEACIEKNYPTGEDGSACFIINPVKGYTWNTAEQEAIEFLIENIFFIIGRTRLMGLMNRVPLTDIMTGAINTSGLMRYGGMLQAKNALHNYVGFFINLKNYKYINQSLGARGGDEMLRKYYMICKKWLLPDEEFARLGGDNFFALIRKERKQQYMDFISCLSISVQLDNNTYKTYDIVSRAGIYDIEAGDTINDVLSNSSVAINMAKVSVSHDMIYFRPNMLEKIIHDKKISNALPHALENREFIVFYQPKVNIKDYSLCGGEALVRWQRNGTFVAPKDFIPVLEHEGSICSLDFYVLDAVCRDIRNWLVSGIEPTKISVNFSKLHLHNNNLSRDIKDVLDRYGIDSKYIEIELTETSGYEDYNALIKFINKMHEYGISISIDDFGTGYSSLNLIKNLHIDIIKLDKSFIDNLDESNTSDVIVIKAIIDMANALGMQTIAEGVETIEQAEFLAKLNCDMIQGYLFDKPLPHDEFVQRLQHNRIYSIK